LSYIKCISSAIASEQKKFTIFALKGELF